MDETESDLREAWGAGLMPGGVAVEAVQTVFLLLLVFVAVFAGLAQRLKLPYPIVLVVAGLLVRDEGQIDDEMMRTLQRELDLAESRMYTGASHVP